ncbi:MAG: S8 family peptidase [Bacteroidota bacterium]
MRFRILASLLFLASVVSAQQIGDGVYWIYFTDKNDNGTRIDLPGDFLSERSVNRRAWQGLAVNHTDEPVTRAYVDELKAMGVQVRHVSRWLNGLAMVNASEQLYREVLEKPFVDTIAWEPADDDVWFPPVPSGTRFDPPLESPPVFDYGIATEQVRQLDMEILHQEGYTGGGVWIAVLDAGFRNVDTLPSFRSMISDGRLLGTRNYVNDTSVFHLVNNHGMYVLSIMGAHLGGQMVGTAPHANYFLCATENVFKETMIEEIAWIEAAEYMDSLGFDVFNTSLGYFDFDGTQYDYTYLDMDGKTSFISRASSMLASKGIVGCQSAGNEGRDSWYRIIAPADALDILSAGAVNSEALIATFSSRGPSWDGRVKPELVAMGSGTGIQYIDGSFGRGSGTSFSAPLLTGSVASLWQAYPDLPAKELIYRIRGTGDRFHHPDNTYGFGIPSFARAFWEISSIRESKVYGRLEIYPNPGRDHVQINLPGSEPGQYTLTCYDMSGRRIITELVHLPGELTRTGELKPGVYILEVITSTSMYHARLIKQ